MQIIIILYGNDRLAGNFKEAVGVEGKMHRKRYSCAQFFVHVDGIIGLFTKYALKESGGLTVSRRNPKFKTLKASVCLFSKKIISFFSFRSFKPLIFGYISTNWTRTLNDPT
jgi:hypothetical protein